MALGRTNLWDVTSFFRRSAGFFSSVANGRSDEVHRSIEPQPVASDGLDCKTRFLRIAVFCKWLREFMRCAKCYARTYTALKVQILNAQRVLLDEFPARFDHIAHQLGEQVIRLDHVIHAYLQ